MDAVLHGSQFGVPCCWRGSMELEYVFPTRLAVAKKTMPNLRAHFESLLPFTHKYPTEQGKCTYLNPESKEWKVLHPRWNHGRVIPKTLQPRAGTTNSLDCHMGEFMLRFISMVTSHLAAARMGGRDLSSSPTTLEVTDESQTAHQMWSSKLPKVTLQ